MADEADYTVDAGTTERIAELGLSTQDRQLVTWDALDSKAWQVFGAGSVVLGLGIAGNLTAHALQIAIPIYFMLAGGALFCLWPRTFFALPEISELWRKYYYRGRDELNHCVVNALAEAGDKNKATLEKKVWGLRVALYALAAQTLTLAIAAAVSR